MSQLTQIFKTLQEIEDNTIHGTSFMHVGYKGMASVMVAKTKNPSEGAGRLQFSSQKEMQKYSQIVKKNMLFSCDFDTTDHNTISLVLKSVNKIFDKADKLN